MMQFIYALINEYEMSGNDFSHFPEVMTQFFYHFLHIA